MSKRRQAPGNGVPVETAAAAADRFFRAYYRHSTAPDEDTLFDLLNALHSLNDKLGKFAGTDLHGSAFFTVLRKLKPTPRSAIFTRRKRDTVAAITLPAKSLA